MDIISCFYSTSFISVWIVCNAKIWDIFKSSDVLERVPVLFFSVKEWAPTFRKYKKKKKFFDLLFLLRSKLHVDA